MKVSFLDKNVRNKFWIYFSVISGILVIIKILSPINTNPTNIAKYTPPNLIAIGDIIPASP